MFNFTLNLPMSSVGSDSRVCCVACLQGAPVS